jgi:hypothetical protein
MAYDKRALTYPFWAQKRAIHRKCGERTITISSFKQTQRLREHETKGQYRGVADAM